LTLLIAAVLIHCCVVIVVDSKFHVTHRISLISFLALYLTVNYILPHINYLKTKTMKIIYLLKILADTSWGTNPKALFWQYIGISFSHCTQTWLWICSLRLCKKIISFQTRTCSYCCPSIISWSFPYFSYIQPTSIIWRTST